MNTKIIRTGIAMTAERAHYVGTSDNYIPEHKQYGYGFMSSDLPEKLGVKIGCNLLEIRSSGNALKGSVNELLGERFIAYYDRDTLFDVVFVDNISGNLRRISLLFSALFILLSVLSMRTTIKRLIDAQSADITTLKSLGYSNRKLMLYYSLYGLFVSVIGTGVGYLCSFGFSKLVQRSQKALISLPKWELRHTAASLAVILLIIVLSVLTSLLAARKSLRGLPAENAQRTSVRSKPSMLEKIGLVNKKASFGLKWTMRDASAHKSRILLGIISLVYRTVVELISKNGGNFVKSDGYMDLGYPFIYSVLILGVVLMIIAYVFNYGCKLQQEADETL